MPEVRYKVDKWGAINTRAGRARISDAIDKVNARQNNTTETVLNILLGIAGIFNVPLGIASVAFGGAIAGNATYLENLEDMLTKIYIKMDQDPSIGAVTITQKYEGRYKGSRGYFYKAMNPTYKFEKSTAV